MHASQSDSAHSHADHDHLCCHHALASGISRRGFLGGLGAAATLTGVGMTTSRAYADPNKPILEENFRKGRPIRVKPVLVNQFFERKELTSWRMYGELQTQAAVDKEIKRIESELKDLSSKADFGIELLPLAMVTSQSQADEVSKCDGDVLLIYAAGGRPVEWLETLVASGKPSLMFLRHRSGPVYLWYEIAHFWLLRKKGDTVIEPNIGVDDIVVDNYDEILWRLRALYGLKNTLGTKIIAIGGPKAYTPLGQKAGPPHAKELWKFEIINAPYGEVDKRLKAARKNSAVMNAVQQQAEAFLARKDVFLKVEKQTVLDTFLTTKIFKEIMEEAGATSIGVGDCMHHLIPITRTPPCLVLSLLNDEGLTAYCHCDYTQTPAGILLRQISDKPSFLCNSHLPHEGLMTFAHCAAPRRMNGQDFEPADIVHHYESDCGAATKVQYTQNQVVTVVIPNFGCTKWIGFRGTIIDSPSYAMCSSQIDMKIDGDWRKLLKDYHGFHTLICYGDYLREVGYALQKVGSMEWENISEEA